MKSYIGLSLSLISIFSFASCASAKAPNELHFANKTEAVLNIHTEGQAGYFADTNPESINDYTGTRIIDESKSQAVKLSWDAFDENQKGAPKYEIKLSFNADMSSIINTYKTNKTELELFNLQIGKTYYFTVAGVYSNGKLESDIFSFKTDGSGVRNLYIPSISNMRDLGGLEIGEGKRIKQGMIYRSAEFNESYTTKNKISSNDKKTLTKELGIVTDVDLRKVVKGSQGIETGGIKSSPLGGSVSYVSCPMVFEGSNVIANEDNKESVLKFFDVLANKDSYPLVFHCAQGKDRTGCLAFAIEALLGVNEDMLLRDYLFTNFSDINGVCKYSDVFSGIKIGGCIRNYATGSTFKEKAYNYLAEEIQIPTQKLDAIISLLSE